MKCLLLLTLAGLTLGLDRCQAPLIPTGVCTLFKDCLFLQTRSVNGSISEFILNYGGCGKRNDDLMLCCPIPKIVWDILPVTSTEKGHQCVSPSEVVSSLGCVTPVKERMTWRDAKENCRQQDTQLLEGISTQRELDELQTHFNTYLFGQGYEGGYAAWIGMVNNTWVVGGDPAPPSSSPLWFGGYPKPIGTGQDCGDVTFLSNGESFLGGSGCSDTPGLPSLCQQTKN